ncbi:MAG: MerR family transcriptional regulator [Pseudonocardiaceae bacterium]|nr:MAG: MerR family transcriptional regulator [Pseudonocardiaceae bacterium]
MPGEKWLTTGELARALGVSRGAVLKWASADPPLITPEFRTPIRGDMRWDLEKVRQQLREARERD